MGRAGGEGLGGAVAWWAGALAIGVHLSSAVLQLLLTRIYLTSKVIPLLAALAVMLCTAMVLIVWSVMGGFLGMLLANGRSFAGDVTISWPNAGFSHYQELIRRLEADPACAAATPMIETFGVVSLPDDRIEVVTIRGIDGPGYARVVDFDRSLWWRPKDAFDRKDEKNEDPRVLTPGAYEAALEAGRRMTVIDPATGRERAAAVLGIELSGMSARLPSGVYVHQSVGRTRTDGSLEWVGGRIIDRDVVLRVVPLDDAGRSFELRSFSVPVANESRTGIFDIDKRTVLVRLDELQRVMKMDAWKRLESPIDPYALGEAGGAGGAATGAERGARVTTILMKAAAGFTADQLRDRAEAIYAGFSQDFRGQVPDVRSLTGNRLIRTWAMSNATLIGAVERETVLVVGILCFISFTASFLILAIFWAMVSEKTRDIGVLRSLGATRLDIALIWLLYGAAIGLLGSGLGVALAYVVVLNINPIHDVLVSLGAGVWDPRVYYFTEIPSRVETSKAVLVGSMGVGFSLLGALVPALRAALLHPVRALRFE